MSKRVLRVLGVLVLTIGLVVAVPIGASASGETQLCFAMDESGSMGITNFNLEKNAIAAAIGDSSILPQDGSVEVTVITFDSDTSEIVSPTVVTAGNAAGIAAAVAAAPYNGGGTDIGGAITECARLMVGSPVFAAAAVSVINVATDGISDAAAMLAARMSAVAAGVDQVHFEAVGSGAVTAPLLAAAWPQPSELVASGDTPTDPATVGFVMDIDSFDDFAPAIAAKVQAIVGENVVDLDVHPTSCPNPINPKSGGITPVAILGSDTFDVLEVDVATVLLEGIAPVRWSVEDVAAPWDGEPSDPVSRYDCAEYGPDGYYDLTLKFKTQELIAAIGPVSQGDVLIVTLTGLTLGGDPFTGTDVIWIR